MNITEFEQHVLNIPSSRGIAETDHWSDSFPNLKSVKHLVDAVKRNEDWGLVEWESVYVVIIQKFIQASEQLGVDQKDFSDFIFSDEILILGPIKCNELDLTKSVNLKSIKILGARGLKRLTIDSVNLEALDITAAPKLHQLDIVNDALQFLSLTNCKSINFENIITKRKGLVFLCLDGNATLQNIDFLEGMDEIRVLGLCGNRLIKEPSTLDTLVKLKNLKWLRITANKKERAQLVEALPGVTWDY